MHSTKTDLTHINFVELLETSKDLGSEEMTLAEKLYLMLDRC